MSYFGKLYLDKEKDIVVNLDMDGGKLSYTILANNHKSDNLINNLAAISGRATTVQDSRTVITGDIPCYIKGDGQQVYILRINGTKIANIYPDGKIEVNSLIPAIAKTLMSQTKDYKYSFRETLLKSYVPQQVKLSTDLHTHGNANLNADILIAMAIKHQIRYPLYYIKKLGLTLTASQQAFIDRQRCQVAQTIDLSGLSGKYLDRKIDDNTFINFAALILQNIENSTANINKIRMSLTILKDSQAVFTNLEKLYLYRYVFTKGVPSDYKIRLVNIENLEDADIRTYLDRMLADNANLNADILIAMAIKHQIRYPLYYIKKLGLTLTDSQQTFIDRQRRQVAQNIDLAGLSGKYLDRKIDDNTFINFAALILQNIENSTANINKIRMSLTILKDSQAVFTNLEKLYLYRYVFTKGVPSDYKIRLVNIENLEDADIRTYLDRMLADNANPDYAINTLYEDTLLWIGREYSKKFIRYVEISDTTLVKKDRSNVRMLSQIHRILPLVKAETGVDIRFLTAIRRIPLTLVKENITSSNYLTEAIQALKVVCKDPYVVGSDFVGEEINDIAELKAVIREIVTQIASNDRNWTIRIHAGENDSLKTNMARAISLVEESLLPGQPFPYMRIGHGLYGASLKSKQGKDLLAKIRQHDVVLEFQLTSNVRLNNIIDLKTHPLKSYLAQGISCVMGTDGCGMYGTDSVDEQLALTNLLKVTDTEFMQMKQVEDAIITRQAANFIAKSAALQQRLGTLTVEDYYTQQLSAPADKISEVMFEINKQPSYPVFREKVKDLPWNKYPVVIAGGSFGGNTAKVSDADRQLLQALLDNLDPDKVFFVVGHRLSGQEKYIVQHNTKFEIYAVIPSLMDKNQLKNLSRAKIDGIRVSTESREMGIYKSFNYEIFERRNCVLIAFDGNSSVANLVQEARNGKARAYIFIYPKSAMLKAKADSLEGYVTINASEDRVITKIRQLEDNIGTKL